VHASTKNYNNLFTSLILNKVCDSETLKMRLSKDNETTTYMPNDEELLTGFKKAKLVNLQTKGILYFIESGIRPARSSTALYGFHNYSLEHLMPKKWRNNWPACVNEDLEKERDAKLLTLGNLAIIPQSLNAAIRDSSWKIKKTGTNSNNPGLAICASGLYTLHDALQKEVWNENEIDARAEWLYKKAKMLWSYEMDSVASKENVEDIIDEADEIEEPVSDAEDISVTDINIPSAKNEKTKSKKQKMTEEMMKSCYKYGKILNTEGNLTEVVEKVVKETGMNQNSAIMYLYAVSNMLDGIIYKRAISTKATEKYFDMILAEYGISGLEKAIRATREHVDYRRACGHMVDSIERICDNYQKKYI